MPKSQLESLFVTLLQAYSLPFPEVEYRFHPTRKWRIDFAWPKLAIGVEIEGGVWSGGRHTRGAGYIADCDKYNQAQLLGWKILRFTTEHLKKRPDESILILKQLLALTEN